MVINVYAMRLTLISTLVFVSANETSRAQLIDTVVKVAAAEIPLRIDTTLYRLDVVDYRVDGGYLHIIDRKNESSFLAFGPQAHIPSVEVLTLATSDSAVAVHNMFMTYCEVDSTLKSNSEWIYITCGKSYPWAYITGPLELRQTQLYVVFAQLIDYLEKKLLFTGPTWRELRGINH